jgi:Na+-transporting methylmalonyl-CoA/oxaloacetate decarboxylase beta subunit
MEEMVEGKKKLEAEKVNKMDFYRKTAIIVGVLFIVATVTALVSIVFMGTTLENSDYLDKVAENENNMIISVIFWIILAVSVAGIGQGLY